jgi:3-methyladenine DNA glycosylase/8-oxoguanine DNA glycosylase
LALSARLPGDHPNPATFTGRHKAVDSAVRRLGALHLPCSATPYHEVLPAILGQRITAAQALAQWARLCERYGEIAPGPLGLRLPPTPERLLAVPSWEFHRLGIEEQRARTLRVAARHAAYIDRTRDLSGAEARRALTALPGIGEWTAAVTVGVSHGDPDALPVGDFHVKNTVAWALTGRARGTDDEMLMTLVPYAGQRWRVVRMLEKTGCGAPKFGPKRRLLDIAAL